MHIIRPDTSVRNQCEEILRSLPKWFGIERSLLEYVEATEQLPTFVAIEEKRTVGFITLKANDDCEWEIHCIAVHRDFRGKGIGTALLSFSEKWLKAEGVRVLLVKTLGEDHPSPEYKKSRAFYRSRGFAEDRIIPDIWGPSTQCLQLRKVIENDGETRNRT